LENYQLKAIHINHRILPEANDFEQYCRKICKKLNVKLHIVRTTVQKKSGESLEALAREARYQLIEKKLKENDIFLTGHHLDDQAETFLLQLLRGAGLKGASAMPAVAKFGKGYLMRPLLSFSRDTIKTYANNYSLDYIHDPSNMDENYDRNYIRHTLMLLFKQKWPKVSQIFSRFSNHCAKQEQLLQEFAMQDYKKCKGMFPNSLLLSTLNEFSLARQKNVLRYWINEYYAHQNFPLSEKTLDQILLTFFTPKDKCPTVKATIKINSTLINIEFRRFKECIYLLSSTELSSRSPLLTTEEKYWCQKNIRDFKKNENLFAVHFRQNGEKIWSANSSHHKRLKNLFQEWGVPTWQRNRIPLIYFRQKLIAVVGYAVFEN